jgi:hypothetical protein
MKNGYGIAPENGIPFRGAIAFALLLSATPTLAAADPPMQAAAAGYRANTFSSQFVKTAVDLASREIPGFQWYPFHFFGQQLPDPSGLIINADSTLTLGANTVGPRSKISLATAAPSRSASRWTGVAFGGGAYIEAVLKFDPRDVINAAPKSQWPGFWSMAIEHLAGLDSEQWKGQAKGYAHFIEPDFFEYDVWKISPGAYGGAVHDWYGIFNVTCPHQFCNLSNASGTNFSNFVIRTPDGTDFTQYHRYGFLWVPATDTAQGYAEYYFDDKQTNDKITWTKFRGEPPPPGTTPWTFGVIDQQHLVVLLDSGPRQPMTVKSVNIWQSSSTGNLKQ